MRVVVYDGILETHVADSLAWAMRSRGHEVLNTGRFGSGFEFPTNEDALQTIRQWVDAAIEFEPDLVIVMRPASLPPAEFARIRMHVPHMYAWFCDDPVLFGLSYEPVVELYDVVLHCGTDRVLGFYEEQFGRPTGVNFPFWTSKEFFPHVYRDYEAESELLFLGNARGALRRQRYHDLTKLRHSIRIHGRTGTDFRGMNGGYLDSDAEVVEAGATALAAINIPQYFQDHRGLETWFDGLGELGHFQYPSRVIQYAAMGLPVFNVGVQIDDQRTFPELVAVASVADIDRVMTELSDSELQALAAKTHLRFQRHFSAASRAMALEALVGGAEWQGLSLEDRTDWFSGFDAASPPPEEPRGDATSHAAPPRTNEPRAAISACPLDVAVLHTGSAWDGASRTASLVRELETMGHRIRIYEGEELRSGSLLSTSSDLVDVFQLESLFAEGRRYDLAIVCPSRQFELQPSRAMLPTKVVLVDEFMKDPLSEADCDLLVSTWDNAASETPGLRLPPVIDRALAQGLDASLTHSSLNTPWYFGASSNSASLYPEVHDEASQVLGGVTHELFESQTVQRIITTVSSHDRAVLLPTRAKSRGREHALFAAFAYAERPILAGRLDDHSIPGIGSSWWQIRDAGELTRKAARLQQRRGRVGHGAVPYRNAIDVVQELLDLVSLPSTLRSDSVFRVDRVRRGRVEVRILGSEVAVHEQLHFRPVGPSRSQALELVSVDGAAIAFTTATGNARILAITAPEITLRFESDASRVESHRGLAPLLGLESQQRSL